ncbi:MAG: hypothetical protein E6J90_16175 [Deltaproteobacteria bacterium]|nr:MAG: hypothetical protein E6J90_16175 [Deltaproteobacteria bacterium]TMQ22211.1 MAG: hypothetical protein E6J91_01630 [Deltaproteobacteria bacterium]
MRAGTSPEGLPIGVQVVARPWREDVALAAAQHIEATLGGWQAPALRFKRGGRAGRRAGYRCLAAGSPWVTSAPRGPKKAIIAVAASMLTATYILRDGVPHKELGSEHLTRSNTAKRLQSVSKILVSRLKSVP